MGGINLEKLNRPFTWPLMWIRLRKGGALVPKFKQSLILTSSNEGVESVMLMFKPKRVIYVGRNHA